MPRVSKTCLGDQDNGWANPSLRSPQYSQSLERGFAILEIFTSERPVRGIADIADELGMSRSTTHRYVTTLVALGFMEQVASRKYRLGLRVTDLGMSALYRTGLLENVRSYLEELRQRTRYTVSLSILDGHEIVYVDRAPSFRRGQNKIDLDLHPGSRLPTYCTAMGKVLLAALPEIELTEVLKEMTLTKHGPNTITSKKILRKELELVTEEGFAVNDQELAEGLHSIAAPIRRGSGEVVAALDVVAPVAMISLYEMVDGLTPHVVATANNISARLGYRRNDEKAA